MVCRLAVETVRLTVPTFTERLTDCSSISIHCVLASINDVYYVWNVSAKSKQCLFYSYQLRLIVYNDAAIITIASSYDI